jgi:glycosyltransferase involved in cell wall biosynthesis
MRPIPWLVANGYVGNFQEVLQALPLVLVTSNWVRDVYARDGVATDNFVVLPVGCDTDAFIPRDRDDPKVAAVREALGVSPDELMILTVGGDAASKGAQEVMQALAMIKRDAPSFKYVCKVWPQDRTVKQNSEDLELAHHLGIEKDVVFTTSINSRNFLPYLMAACDIYAGPSRLEGFGMPHVEAGACGKPVVGIRAMALLDTLVHGETALLADVASEVWIKEALVGPDQGFDSSRRIVFPHSRAADYRASVHNIAEHLLTLMNDGALRKKMGETARRRVVENYDYRVVARRFVEATEKAFGRL